MQLSWSGHPPEPYARSTQAPECLSLSDSSSVQVLLDIAFRKAHTCSALSLSSPPRLPKKKPKKIYSWYDWTQFGPVLEEWNFRHFLSPLLARSADESCDVLVPLLHRTLPEPLTNTKSKWKGRKGRGGGVRGGVIRSWSTARPICWIVLHRSSWRMYSQSHYQNLLEQRDPWGPPISHAGQGAEQSMSAMASTL